MTDEIVSSGLQKLAASLQWTQGRVGKDSSSENASSPRISLNRLLLDAR